MIKINNASFGYQRSKTLFEGLNLEIPRGHIIGLLGRNGEGKSTLMKLMLGQLLPRTGEVTLFGYPSRKRTIEALGQVYILAEEVTLPRTTVRAYFDMIAPLYPTYDSDLADRLLAEFELRWGYKLHNLSLGQRKKVCIALALSLRTPLLLLDEPTNGLDIPSKSIFRRMLAGSISPDQTIIISTHQVRDLEQLIDRLLLLDGNRIVCHEAIEDLEQIFSFGAVEPGREAGLIYCERSIGGDYGVWSGVDQTGEGTFSMELFFNAMIGAREPMQRALSEYKRTNIIQ